MIQAGLYDSTDGLFSLKRQEYKLLFLWSRLLAFDEYDRAKVGQLSFVDFLELLARCADIHAEKKFQCHQEYKKPLAKSLASFLEILLTGIAIHCGGKLAVIAPGNSNNGRVAADISHYLFKYRAGGGSKSAPDAFAAHEDTTRSQQNPPSPKAGSIPLI